MAKFKGIVKKTWIFAAAAAMITVSSSAMVFALDRNVPAGIAGDVSAVTAAASADTQAQASVSAAAAEYTLIDFSQIDPERKNLIMDKLSHSKNLTPAEVEENFKKIIYNMTPGEKDISAQQAAAYAADILKKAYEVDFKGYTAEASFSRSPVPNSDGWTVIFHAPEEGQNPDRQRSRSYIASMDSVKGTILSASFFDPNYETVISKNLEDPAWVEEAKKDISVFLAENVSITGSKVVSATPEIGVTVVFEISDGSAYAVRLTGDEKTASAYIYFPDGYDGSLDYKPVTENGVG